MLILERRCPVCNRLSKGVCSSCLSDFNISNSKIEVQGLESFSSLFVYDSKSSRAILAAKQAQRIDVLNQLAIMLGQFVKDLNLDVCPDSVTWVPASKFEKRRRGFDQGKILAKQVSKKLDLRSNRMLLRRTSERQVGKNRVSRLSGPNFKTRSCPFQNVLLIDDVVTTGASMRSAAMELKSAGCKAVHGVSLAYVNPK